MAQGPNYNVILPFTTTAGIAVPSTIVVGGLTVNGDISAQRFVALNTGDGLSPAFTFTGVGTNTGMFLNTTTPALTFSVGGTIVADFEMRSFAGGPTQPALRLGAAQPLFVTFDPISTARMAMYSANATLAATLQVQGVVINPATLNNGLFHANGNMGFVFDVDGNAAIQQSGVGTYAATWENGTGQHFNRPGITQYATTTMTASTGRSLSTISNLLTAANNTLFVTLPTSIAGVKYTIANAKATGQTVVINPVAADVLNVFGLTKAAGASVAANAAFSSITFHCITSTQWLATDIMGTWV